MDDSTTLNSVEWGGTSTFYIETDIPKFVTITDINSIESSGAGSVNFKRIRLNAGVNNVTMDLSSDGGSRAVTIADRNNMIYASNDDKPLFEDITRADFYLLGLIVAISSPFQIFTRLKIFRYRLKRGLTRIV